jgi:hypothetical protein
MRVILLPFQLGAKSYSTTFVSSDFVAQALAPVSRLQAWSLPGLMFASSEGRRFSFIPLRLISLLELCVIYVVIQLGLQLTLLSSIVLDQLPPVRCCPNHVSSPRSSTHAFSRQLPSIIYLRRCSCLTTDRLLLFLYSGYPVFVFDLLLFALIYTFTFETRVYRPPTYDGSAETLTHEATYELDIPFISHPFSNPTRLMLIATVDWSKAVYGNMRLYIRH